jgi:hypothetical protein
MDEPATTELLKDLHARLRNTHAITDRDRELLAQLSADIQSLLGHSGGLAAANPRSVVERLQESIARFEVSHPDLTDLMARASKVLSDMGI